MSNQVEISRKFNATPAPPRKDEKLGIALETIGKLPINGLRHRPENGTCGWFIWCGEVLPSDPDCFKPLHVFHLNEYLPEAEKYLALPPGFRLLIAKEYEDVWHDPQLL